MLVSVLWVLLGLYGLIVLAWTWGVIALRNYRVDDQLQIPPLPIWPGGEAPGLTILIAAHNETDSIESCLRAILTQAYPRIEIIVADDRSSDDTSAIVRRVAQADPRVRLVRIDQLPAGWIGKTHALAVATREATGQYLLFVDSDVRLVDGAVNAVMHKAVADRVDFLSLWPSLELLSPSERLLTPPAGWLLSFWALLGTGIRALASEIKLGNGQFMLIRRDAYERLGGHAGVQAELAEDAIMAHRAADLGMSRWAGLGRGLYVTARDGSFGRSANAIARVIVGSLCSPWRVLFSTQILLGGCVMPLWLLPLSLGFAAATGSIIAALFAALALCHFVSMILVLRSLFALTLVKRGSLLLFPFGCIVVVGLLVWSWLIMTGRGTVRWGKTRYLVRGSRIERVVPDPAPVVGAG